MANAINDNVNLRNYTENLPITPTRGEYRPLQNPNIYMSDFMINRIIDEENMILDMLKQSHFRPNNQQNKEIKALKGRISRHEADLNNDAYVLANNSPDAVFNKASEIYGKYIDANKLYQSADDKYWRFGEKLGYDHPRTSLVGRVRKNNADKLSGYEFALKYLSDSAKDFGYDQYINYESYLGNKNPYYMLSEDALADYYKGQSARSNNINNNIEASRPSASVNDYTLDPKLSMTDVLNFSDYTKAKRNKYAPLNIDPMMLTENSHIPFGNGYSIVNGGNNSYMKKSMIVPLGNGEVAMGNQYYTADGNNGWWNGKTVKTTPINKSEINNRQFNTTKTNKSVNSSAEKWGPLALLALSLGTAMYPNKADAQSSFEEEYKYDDY